MGKWFPVVYDCVMEPLEKRFIRDIRKQLIGKAEGNVLEIGSGTGANFHYYDHELVEHVMTIEPSQRMREQALQKAKRASVPIEILPAKGEDLPFSDNMFDTVVGTLVLCTIADPMRALGEIRRVCKPGGKVLLFEHVRLNDPPMLGKIQDWLTPVWKRLCDGCHLNRNTLEMAKQSGLEIIDTEAYHNQLFLFIEALNRK
ncbi:class I SAM-dependent methyltransferase [Fodinisporobacter ferrooxydans]|uniref:Class I SAM-dependent methyltransferase n=1 Tax=Fodinisporobacter ferrooxydans TaxID=2901836 RepID=A0ABY4CK64_9BACL|nr:class I SAM-dependent methyltransferase [Alicyclobacillaceae bacterium MYW30-H2]